MRLLESGLSYASLFFGIENVSRKLEEADNEADPKVQSEIKTFRKARRMLSEVLASDWDQLLRIQGATIYGAVALSWCKDAELSQVWEGWEASGFPLKPLPEYERPARFINPALLPTTNSLLELVKLAENKPLPICAMIVAKGDALDVDLSVNMAANASPQIAAFLKAHMERQQNRTEEQNEMIEIWTSKISGTEWEV